MYFRTARLLAAGRKRQSAAKTYLKQAKRRLICPYSQKKAFLSQLEDELFLFSTETENADWNALVAQFGTPENTADEFMSGLEPCWQQWFLRRWYWAATAVCTVLALSMVLSVCYALNCQSLLNDPNYIETITYKVDTLPDVTGPTYDYYEFSSEDNVGEVSEK